MRILAVSLVSGRPLPACKPQFFFMSIFDILIQQDISPPLAGITCNSAITVISECPKAMWQTKPSRTLDPFSLACGSTNMLGTSTDAAHSRKGLGVDLHRNHGRMINTALMSRNRHQTHHCMSWRFDEQKDFSLFILTPAKP